MLRPGRLAPARRFCFIVMLLVAASPALGAGVIQFATRLVQVDENTTGTVTVVRTGDASGAVSAVLNVGIAGTATFGTDFQITLPTGTVDFADGETFRHITVDLIDDSDEEGTEFGTLALSSPGGGATLGRQDALRLEIRDDETAAVQVGFANAALERLPEGNSVDITISKGATSTTAFTVDVNATAGTATEATDYTDPMATLTFDPGPAEDQVFTFFSLEDGLLEGNEDLELRLFVSDTSAAVPDVPARRVLIEDDEPNQPGEFQLSAPSGTSVSENAGSISLTATRIDGSSGAVSVDFVTIDGIEGNIATAGTDYEAATGTLDFADGQTSQTFAITVLNDNVARANNRQFEVRLANPVGGASIDAAAQGLILSIQEDDGTPDDDDCIGICDCFIATAAYGSYLDPHVDTLREFRNEYLLSHVPGRAFVDWYYRISPGIASVIAEHAFLRWSVRAVLTPIVYLIEYPLKSGLALLVLGGLLLKRRRRRHRTPAA